MDLGVVDLDFDTNTGRPNPDDPIDAHLMTKIDDPGLGDPDAPIVVFVHGFQFDPRIRTEDESGAVAPPGKSTNPHVQLFHFNEVPSEDDPAEPGSEQEHDSHASPWFRRAAGAGAETDFPGLAIGFGYESWGNELKDDTPSTGDFWRALVNLDWQNGAFRNVYAQAYLDAENAATALATIVDRLDRVLTERGDDRKIDFFAHSLGTRTALLALDILARHRRHSKAIDRVGRTLLLAGAASWLVARKILRNLLVARPSHPPQIFNFPSSEDAIVSVLGARGALQAAAETSGTDDGLLQRAHRFIKGGEMIGREGRPDLSIFTGPPDEYSNWIDIQLDDPVTKEWALGKGYKLTGDRRSTIRLWPPKVQIETLDHWITGCTIRSPGTGNYTGMCWLGETGLSLNSSARRSRPRVVRSVGGTGRVGVDPPYA